MTDIRTIATDSLLHPTNLSQTDITSVLGQMLGGQVTGADLYFQKIYHESWVLEDGQVKQGAFNIDKGVGVRAIAEDKTGFAYSSDLSLPALQSAARAAKSIANVGNMQTLSTQKIPVVVPLYPAINPIESLATADKIALLERLDKLARHLDSRVSEVSISLNGVYDIVMIATADGRMVPDVRPLVRLNVSVLVEQQGRREHASVGGGIRGGYEYFLENHQAEAYVRDAVRQACLNLEAKPAPAGMMPVVLGPGWPGVLLHEAVGHGLEGDFNRKETSTFSHRIGEQVASSGVTVVDDGTLPGRRGSLSVDDEGTPTQSTVLIEDGILKNYMHDNLNARLMGMSSTGNCRRESFAHIPMPRMTNTFMLAGEHHPEEIIQSVERGLYAVNFSGGQVDITSGKFVFSTSEAYLIENGKITYPVKGATLIGNGPEVMQNVSMIGNDLALDSGIGVCGKDGQSVPVGVGQPTLKISQLTVGGTG